jgi:hypothetical protein
MTDIVELLENFPEAGVRFERKDGLVHVYLDTPEALSLAPSFLPPTKRGVAPDGREVWVYREKRGVAEPLSATGFTGVREYTKHDEATERGAMDAAKAEAVEGELDSLIERRAGEARDADRVEELWKGSSRGEAMKRREANRWLWIRHFEAVAEVLRKRAEEFDVKAKELMETEAG